MIVAELSMTGLSHVYFNSAFLRILSFAMESPITFFCEEHHCENLRIRLKDYNIKYNTFTMKSRLGVGVFLQDFRGCYLIYKIMRCANKHEPIIILNRLPLTLIVCNILNLIQKRIIYNVLHGELEYLVNPGIRGGTKYYYKLFRLAYLLFTKRNVNVFLGKSIYDETMKSNICFGNAKFVIIDHPYEYNSSNNSTKSSFCDTIHIGMIGTATRRKNSHYLSKLDKLVINKNIKICNIGRAETDLYTCLSESNVSFFKDSISGDEYESLIASLDYSLCFYDSKINLALASGSFFDSIKFAKPILALRGNPYVDYYFRKLGNIGYQFDTLKEMSNFINNIMDENMIDYNNQVNNLRKAQQLLSIENIARDFQKQIASL